MSFKVIFNISAITDEDNVFFENCPFMNNAARVSYYSEIIIKALFEQHKLQLSEDSFVKHLLNETPFLYEVLKNSLDAGAKKIKIEVFKYETRDSIRITDIFDSKPEAIKPLIKPDDFNSLLMKTSYKKKLKSDGKTGFYGGANLGLLALYLSGKIAANSDNLFSQKTIGTTSYFELDLVQSEEINSGAVLSISGSHGLNLPYNETCKSILNFRKSYVLEQDNNHDINSDIEFVKDLVISNFRFKSDSQQIVSSSNLSNRLKQKGINITPIVINR